MRKIRALIGGGIAALAFVALTPVPAQAVAAPIYQTDLATCRANLAKSGSILIIGDSITAGWFSASTLQYASAARPACINGQPGRATAGAVAVLASYKKEGLITPTTTVVMAIGSNDTYGAKNGYMRWQVDNAERIVGLSQPLQWVDVLNWSLSRGFAAQHIYGLGTWTVNLQLWAKDAQYPNLKVAHWNVMIRSAPTKYVSDLLHTNTNGNTARNNLIMGTVGSIV